MRGAGPAPSLADLQRVALKVFLPADAALDPRDLIPVFHRWIQTRAVDGLLIDVADYTHMTSGPAVLLAAHEGHYALERSGGRLGLQYTRRAPLPGPLPDRLLALTRILVGAARQLETDPSLGGDVRFLGREFACVANDRLLAPNTRDTLTAFRPALDPLLTRLAPDGEWTVTREPDHRERFAVIASGPGDPALETLEARLR